MTLDEASVDSKISAALDRVPEEDWAALWDAVDALDGETNYATWAGGDLVGTTVVDGEERPVRTMPYPVYAPKVEEVLMRLGRLGLMIPFDWMSWDGLSRYIHQPGALATAPVTDAVRVLIAIRRAERFGDGNIEGALKSGLMQTALDRLRRWHRDHPPSRGSPEPG